MITTKYITFFANEHKQVMALPHYILPANINNEGTSPLYFANEHKQFMALPHYILPMNINKS